MKRNRRKNKSTPPTQGPAPAAGHSLQIADDMAFHIRDWRAERIAWAAMVAIVTAALLGLFSSGPLSSARATHPSGALDVEYSRFMRFGAPETMIVRLRPEAGASNGSALLLDQRFIEAFRIVSVAPPPSRSLAAAGGMRMEFASSAEPAAAIHLHLEPVRYGWVSPRLALPGGTDLRLPAFIYP